MYPHTLSTGKLQRVYAGRLDVQAAHSRLRRSHALRSRSVPDTGPRLWVLPRLALPISAILFAAARKTALPLLCTEGFPATCAARCVQYRLHARTPTDRGLPMAKGACTVPGDPNGDAAFPRLQTTGANLPSST